MQNKSIQKMVLMSLVLACSIVMSACTTAKGLGPVDKYLSEKGTCGKVYEPWIAKRVADQKLTQEESKPLKDDLNDTREKVAELRSKKYAPMSFLWGSSFEKDLDPIYDFLKNQNGKNFKFQDWIKEEKDAGNLDELAARQFIIETETMQKIIEALINGQSLNVEDK